MLFPVLSVVLTALHLLGFSSRVVGQQSGVVCTSTYSWASNSLAQNPCVVASYLQGACDSGGFNVPKLPVGTHYAPPESNYCECNTVVYSLISACADCQGSSYLTWTDWSVNCSGNVFVQTFPEAIPTGTAVPAWAYLNVVTTDTYSPFAAEDNVGVESAAPTSTIAPVTFPTTFPTTTPTSSVSGVNSKKQTNVGAVAGGVVSGIGAIAIIVGLVLFFVMRSRRSHVAPSTAYMDSNAPLASPPPMAQYPAPDPFPVQKADHNGTGTIPPSTATSPATQYTVDLFSRPYDPSDSSTFPTNLNATPSYPSQPGSPGYPSPTGSPSYGSQTNSASHTSQYRGIAQV